MPNAEAVSTPEAATSGVDTNGRGPWFRTYGGHKLYYLDPKPEDISIHDIAHSLSRQCRFNGHTHDFYSVAQHSVHVAELVPPQDKLEALLHDATEAYVGDMVRPIKRMLLPFVRLELEIGKAVRQRFGLRPEEPESVKVADNIMLLTEWRDVMRQTAEQLPNMPAGLAPRVLKISCWYPDMAKQAFLGMWGDLRPDGWRD